MKSRFVSLSLSVLLLLTVFSSFGQTDGFPRHALSIQPAITLDSFFPRMPFGIGAQYEYTLSHDYSLAAHALWYRDHIESFGTMQPVDGGTEGGAFSGEFRYYFSGNSKGWHIGPFGEWSFFTYLSDWKDYYGSGFTHSFELGALAGYKWVTENLTFDISARTAMFFNRKPDINDFYPSSGEVRSHLLVSLGYVIN